MCGWWMNMVGKFDNLAPSLAPHIWTIISHFNPRLSAVRAPPTYAFISLSHSPPATHRLQTHQLKITLIVRISTNPEHSESICPLPHASPGLESQRSSVGNNRVGSKYYVILVRRMCIRILPTHQGRAAPVPAAPNVVARREPLYVGSDVILPANCSPVSRTPGR
ncbi:hypothetical protein AG1IA_08425 [Rhizoctonia solani AG-1 IA]|uniref:Uncharacterized protein n=1 Tax=Thanatephorus cucumeris (strain AG1-IA) TaxID=983506 RepID=L8WH72_THACA|nr:hypothetical protein AG1IA_08425 [Rhizoctonia solani AG-1 IA]